MEKIYDLITWDLDLCGEVWQDDRDVRITERNLTAIFKKQCEVIKAVNKIIEHFKLDIER